MRKILIIGIACLYIMFGFSVDAIADPEITISIHDSGNADPDIITISKHDPGNPVQDITISIADPRKDATKYTKEANQQLSDELPFKEDEDVGTKDGDFDNADRGFLGSKEDNIDDGNGTIVWDFDKYDFIGDPKDRSNNAPGTVNPSLWRNAKLNLHHGLYEVVEDRIY
ncbi:MAG: hypothetical protein F6K26_49880, partial [Moorea sp. SIO2I5]|nr:hypothetical protein [Moorena sp. SIO2I5]